MFTVYKFIAELRNLFYSAQLSSATDLHLPGNSDTEITKLRVMGLDGRFLGMLTVVSAL